MHSHTLEIPVLKLQWNMRQTTKTVSIQTIVALAIFSLCLILFFIWETDSIYWSSAGVYANSSLRLKQACINSGVSNTEAAIIEARKCLSAKQSVPTRAYQHKNESLQTRRKLLNRECDKLHRSTIGYSYGKVSPQGKGHIIVDDQYKVLYCIVPKVACTNLKRIFLVLTGKMNVTDPLQLRSPEVHHELNHYLTHLHTLPPDRIMYRLKTYKKVLFVRDPLTRVLSAYRNKFLEGKNQFLNHRYGKKILEHFHKSSLKKNNHLKFTEFIDFVINSKTEELNDHWDSIYNLCSPCNIRYDFIGKLETFEEDVNQLLHEIGAEDIVKLPSREKTYRKEKTEDTLQEFYKEIAPEKIVKLIDSYKVDYSLFGYKVPKIIREIAEM